LHPEASELEKIIIPEYPTIAVALDFSSNDIKLINHAIGQGSQKTTYLLIHVVESPTSRLLGKETDDMESRKDQERLEHYVARLKEKGFSAKGILGFNDRVKEIVRIINENKAEMLVIGAHGHTGLKDMLYGHTVNAVRHEVKIPVLVINI
jgi:manganese transport protein